MPCIGPDILTGGDEYWFPSKINVSFIEILIAVGESTWWCKSKLFFSLLKVGDHVILPPHGVEHGSVSVIESLNLGSF